MRHEHDTSALSALSRFRAALGALGIAALAALAGPAVAQDSAAAGEAADTVSAAVGYEQALAWYNARDFARARGAFQAVVAGSTQSTTVTQAAEFYGVKCLYDLGDYDGFTSEARALKAAKPSHPALDDLAFVEVLIAGQRGDGVSAAALLERFAADFPSSPYAAKVPAHLARAQGMAGLGPALKLYHTEKDYENAHDAFVAGAAAQDPAARAVAEFYALRCLFELKSFGEFNGQVDALRAANPNHPYLDELTLLQAYVVEKGHDWNRAWERYESFLQTYPSSQLTSRALSHLRALEPLAEPPLGTAKGAAQTAETERYLAWMRRMKQEGEWEKVRAGGARFTATYPTSPLAGDGLLLAAEAADEQGDTSASQESIADLLARLPDSPAALRTAGSVAGEAQVRLQIAAAADGLRGAGVAAAATALDDLVTARPNHWQAPRARRLLARALLKDSRYGDAAQAADAAVAVEETPRHRDELLFVKAAARALSGEGAAARQVLDDLVARNDTGHYYTNFVVLALEKCAREGDYELAARIADALVPLYGQETREWAAAMMYSAMARVTLGGAQNRALAAQRLEKVWDACAADPDFRNHTRAVAAQWLIYLAKSAGDPQAATAWYARLRDGVPPCRVRTVVMRQCGEFGN
jgi:TolA-binding protein